MNKNLDSELKKALVTFEFDEIARLINAGANPDLKGSDGNLVISMACWYANESLVKLLLEKGARPDLLNGQALWTALNSPNGETINIIQMLIENGAKVNRIYDIYKKNRTPLHEAILRDKIHIAELLLEMGADPLIKDKEGKTAKDLARENGYKDLFTESKQGTIKKNLFIEKSFNARFNKLAKNKMHISGDPNLKDLFQGTNFPGCGNPPVHLLTLDIDKIPEFPAEIKKLGKLNVIFHSCSCEEEDEYNFKINKNGKLESLDNYKKQKCPKEDYSGSDKISFFNLEESTDNNYEGITVGAKPSWAQSNQWPSCPSCRVKSFYVCNIYQFYVPLTARGRGNMINVFVCPECKIETLIRQNT